ncbi:MULTISPECIES: IS200/IS605 family accessory protein TnpB-related protein [unclassified Streptomyces]|uniref:IS200/IS605 family accessory protein TnpB-related protein n=1 Tax=unclassified Streptomyces TaxID=2593676 RepID=UPI00386E93F2|nr:transposase [Streptomyces sp. NBC_00827]
MSIRTRLHLSERDEQVLGELGGFLSQLATRDLAERVFLGTEHSNEDFARRKREIAALSSARWAGTITRGSNDQWALARRAQTAHLAQLEQAVETLAARLAVPVAACDIDTRTKGYPTQAVKAAKQTRHQHLRVTADQVRADLQAGIVHVVRGGKDLLHTRLHLKQAGLREETWRQRWRDARCRIEADGESGKTFGNQSLRVSPTGEVLIKLPDELAARYAAFCDRFGRYQLDATCAFAYRSTEWGAQVTAHRAVGYSISFQARRCYLSAAFTPARPDLPEGMDDEALMKAALAGGVIGVDHNADHLATWRLDVHGNPVGRPVRIDVDYAGSTGRRDAQVRHACSELIRAAKDSGATALVIEDLGFDTGRETCGGSGARSKRFRATVAGMPTTKFASRLTAMAHRAGLAVIIVDPAYSSRWGTAHWRQATSTDHHKTSGHQAAALVLGRRGQGLGARRRAEKTVPRKKTEAAHNRSVRTPPGAGTEDHRPPVSAHQPTLPAHPGPTATPRTMHTMHEADSPRQRPSLPNTVRGRPVNTVPDQGLTKTHC